MTEPCPDGTITGEHGPHYWRYGKEEPSVRRLCTGRDADGNPGVNLEVASPFVTVALGKRPPASGRECGGCQGLGAHWRWCPQVVGPVASNYGRLAAQIESLGDQVGPNEMGAANHLWQAAALMRKLATEKSIQYHEHIVEETRRLENLEEPR